MSTYKDEPFADEAASAEEPEMVDFAGSSNQTDAAPPPAEPETEMVNFVTHSTPASGDDFPKTKYRDTPLDHAGNVAGRHDQLPSVEEAQAYRDNERALYKEKRRVHRPFCDAATFLLSCVLVSVVAGFLVTLFFVFFEVNPSGQDESKLPVNDNIPTNADPAPPNPHAMSKIYLALRDTVALQQGQEFNDPLTYQSKALHYLESKSDEYEAYPPDKLTQAYALACVYYGTDGPASWDDRYTQQSWMHFTDPCWWHGVSCNTVQKLVTRLDLYGANMQGKLVPEMKLLGSTLDYLLLDKNPGLTGEIPAFLGDMGLATLTVTECGFTGHMPGAVCDHHELHPNFNLLVDCDKIFCQPSCCENCNL